MSRSCAAAPMPASWSASSSRIRTVEEVKARTSAILWATRRDALNHSVMRKLIGGAAYKELTVRNLNTTLKLNQLLNG